MTEAVGSNTTPDQSVQLADLNYCDLSFEQKIWMTESKQSDMTPDHKDQMTEVSNSGTSAGLKDELSEAVGSNTIPDQSVQLADLNHCDLSFEQKIWMTESKHSDMRPDHKDQMTEVSNSGTSAGLKDELSEDGSSDTSANFEGQLIYRCKKCRQIVASQENVVSHNQGKGEGSFRGRKKGVEPNLPECTAIFVEPLKWMQAVEEGYVWEKLYCMRCKTKLGSFNWAGMQCSCGAWVNPAFQILKSHVDVCQI